MPDIQTWDSGGTWDSGLQYDVNNFPSLGDIDPYLNLITNEHRDQPNFIASLSALLQPLADNIATLQQMIPAFDLDSAVGDQLDIIGKWIGRTRELSVPLPGVYFSFDDSSLGFDQGTWKGPFDPSSGLVNLPDSFYRTYLRAAIAANQWDGTIPSAYQVWDIIFHGTGSSIFIVDNGDMTMYFGLVGGDTDAVTKALLTGGYLSLRPAGVEILGYYTASYLGSPIFGFDVEVPAISGFDVGSLAVLLPPTT